MGTKYISGDLDVLGTIKQNGSAIGGGGNNHLYKHQIIISLQYNKSGETFQGMSFTFVFEIINDMSDIDMYEDFGEGDHLTLAAFVSNFLMSDYDTLIGRIYGVPALYPSEGGVCIMYLKSEYNNQFYLHFVFNAHQSYSGDDWATDGTGGSSVDSVGSIMSGTGAIVICTDTLFTDWINTITLNTTTLI